MTFVIVPSNSSTAGGDVPRIGYDNIFRSSSATVTTSGAETGYEAALGYDWLTNTAWQSDAAGNSWIKADAGVGNTFTCDYLACYAPDLGANSGTIKLQHSDNDSTWTDVTSALAPTVARPIVQEFFTAASHRYWRIYVASTPASLIPVFAAGVSILFDQGLEAGYAAPLLSRDMNIMNYRTGGGTFVNRKIRRNGCTQTIRTKNNSDTWIRNYGLPLIKHAELLPFFWFWQPTGKPTESALLWMENSNAMSYSAVGFLNFNMSCRGVCNDL